MFRFIDRWQTSLRDAWIGKRDDELFRLLELRDLTLEAYLDAYETWADWDGAVKFNGSATNVTSTGRWKRSPGNMIDAEIEWTTTGAVTAGTMSIALPVEPFTSGANVGHPVGLAHMLDSGTGRRTAHVVQDTGAPTTANVDLSGGYLNLVSNTNPWTWANTDAGQAILRYRAVNP